jgi:CRISPR-associated protein Csm3
MVEKININNYQKLAIMSDIHLKKKIIYTGIIVLKTGLHIGGTNAALNIGGPDKFVIRNPLNNMPYIPGSSLKGKMRALIEIYNKCVWVDPQKSGTWASKDASSKSGVLFGVAGDTENSRPSRLIVRDAELITEETEITKRHKLIVPKFNNTDLPFTESKTEVAIDRVTAKPNPRTFERVPAGALFKLSMVLNVFDGDEEDKLKATLKQAIELLKDDYLGGHGSRGYGQVEIVLDGEDGVSKIY